MADDSGEDGMMAHYRVVFPEEVLEFSIPYANPKAAADEMVRTYVRQKAVAVRVEMWNCEREERYVVEGTPEGKGPDHEPMKPPLTFQSPVPFSTLRPWQGCIVVEGYTNHFWGPWVKVHEGPTRTIYERACAVCGGSQADLRCTQSAR